MWWLSKSDTSGVCVLFSHSSLDWLCHPRRPALSLLGQVRTATKRAGGTIKNHGGSAGRRLGVKKFSGKFYSRGYQFVAPLITSLQTSLLLPVQLLLDREAPSSILASMSVSFHASPFITFDSLQVLMGRDHTLYAAVPGYVRFYVQASGRFSRKYVGLVLNRGERLPRDEVACGRSRYFGLVELNGVSAP
jgi:large subunit ribosomal protein L27